MFFVGDVIGKKITDKQLITNRRNIFVSRTVKSCSVHRHHMSHISSRMIEMKAQ
jgi:hypothetical protein